MCFFCSVVCGSITAIVVGVFLFLVGVIMIAVGSAADSVAARSRNAVISVGGIFSAAGIAVFIGGIIAWIKKN